MEEVENSVPIAAPRLKVSPPPSLRVHLCLSYVCVANVCWGCLQGGNFAATVAPNKDRVRASTTATTSYLILNTYYLLLTTYYLLLTTFSTSLPQTKERRQQRPARRRRRRRTTIARTRATATTTTATATPTPTATATSTAAATATAGATVRGEVRESGSFRQQERRQIRPARSAKRV